MAEAQLLTAEPRKETGSRAMRRLRAAGHVPAILYGHGIDAVPLSLPADEVRAAVRHGSRVVDVRMSRQTEKALLRDLQWDVFGKEILHVDLVRVSLDERIEVEVPIELRGTAPGIAQGGRLDQPLHTVMIECLATAIPEHLQVAVNTLELGGAIHVRDLPLPEGVKVLNDPDALVAHVVRVEEEVEEAVAAPEPEAAEPQLIRREKPEEEAEE
jgi:large subunit ribosomal protein L25